jgi:hypothetical protein
MSSLRLLLCATFVLLIVFLTVSCSTEYDIILLSDPLFEQEIAPSIDPMFPEQGRTTLIVYDPIENSQRLKASHLVLTPGLSKTLRLDQDRRLEQSVAAWEEEGSEVVLMFSRQTAEDLQGRSSRRMISFDPAAGWNQIDAYLQDTYENPAKIGVLYDPSVYGGEYEIEQLLPELFADSSAAPESLVDREGFNSEARMESALESFSSRGVEVVLLIVGGKTSQALPLLDKHDMLAVVEYGQALDAYQMVCLASIEIDYAATFTALLEQDRSVIPMVQKVVYYR